MWKAIGAVLLLIGASAPAIAGSDAKAPPYWVSISASRAKMRTGPGRNYPATWLYQRVQLPVKVIEVYQSWRKIEDPDGTRGWMLVNLLSDKRTGLIKDEPRPLRAAPERSARVLWMAAPGVVGRISKCEHGWCWFDAGKGSGYVEIADIWGADPGEEIH